MEEGYIYFNKHLKALPSRRGGPARRQKNKLVESANPPANVTLAAAPGMSFGRVSKILGLPSSSIHPEMQHFPLKDLVLLRLEKRVNPTYDSLEEFFKIRSSCHIVEEINNDFFCDCAQGIAGHLCKHTMALTYERTDFPVDRRLNAVKFKRRSRGRPRGIGLAAARTRDEGPALESEDDSEGGEGGDPQPVGGRGGGAIPGRARGRGRGPRRARGTGAGSQTRDQGPEDDADPEGGVMEDPQPGGSRGGGAIPRGARGRGRGPQRARVTGGGSRGRGGQLRGHTEEDAEFLQQLGSVVLPGNLWDSFATNIGPVQVDGGILRVADDGTSQEEEDAGSQDSQEEDDLELELNL